MLINKNVSVYVRYASEHPEVVKCFSHPAEHKTLYITTGVSKLNKYFLCDICSLSIATLNSWHNVGETILYILTGVFCW